MTARPAAATASGATPQRTSVRPKGGAPRGHGHAAGERRPGARDEPAAVPSLALMHRSFAALMYRSFRSF
ncbi:hypothetical protein ABT030_50920 [Streptomyces mirabilis]|uniref:hypothetical protein n=1 Tax=Streptomyces mirabilis TaxID=68239 RepID=UPI00332A9088